MIIDILLSLLVFSTFWTIAGGFIFFEILKRAHSRNKSVRPRDNKFATLVCGPVAWIYMFHPALLFLSSPDELERFLETDK